MDLSKYQTEAYKLAIYPEVYKGLYPMLKLMGELGEFEDVLSEPVVNLDDLNKEAGDVMWYVAAVATDMGIDLGTLEKDQPGACLATSISEAMKLCETLGKLARDGKISDERRALIPAQLAAIMNGAIATCGHMGGGSRAAILRLNLEKLTSRKERGKLSGDGDNR